ncbi:hypothetical protein EVAR_50080_1 [Eumeta japonica]|uniref:Uncharacterized protein n=1 Tax=Eumeta variegata TaxID=151549 RepID=A0A4C1ZU11_EUMVA|nr:hypothetical protein EVAR_50080_1 [Eumeta japonica]
MVHAASTTTLTPSAGNRNTSKTNTKLVSSYLPYNHWTSTAGPEPSTQWWPDAFTRSSVYLVRSHPKLRRRVRDRHLPTFLPRQLSVLRAMWSNRCYFNFMLRVPYFLIKTEPLWDHFVDGPCASVCQDFLSQEIMEKPNEDCDCNLERNRDQNQENYPNQSWEQDGRSKQKMEEHILYPRRRAREREASH